MQIGEIIWYTVCKVYKMNTIFLVVYHSVHKEKLNLLQISNGFNNITAEEEELLTTDFSLIVRPEQPPHSPSRHFKHTPPTRGEKQSSNRPELTLPMLFEELAKSDEKFSHRFKGLESQISDLYEIVNDFTRRSDANPAGDGAAAGEIDDNVKNENEAKLYEERGILDEDVGKLDVNPAGDDQGDGAAAGEMDDNVTNENDAKMYEELGTLGEEVWKDSIWDLDDSSVILEENNVSNLVRRERADDSKKRKGYKPRGGKNKKAKTGKKKKMAQMENIGDIAVASTQEKENPESQLLANIGGRENTTIPEIVKYLGDYFEKNPNGHEIVFNTEKIKINISQIKELVTNNWLTDSHIDAFAFLLAEKALRMPESYHRFLYISPNWHENLAFGDGFLFDNYLTHMTKEAIKKSLYLILPIYLKEHWILAIASLKEKSWKVFDSLPREHHFHIVPKVFQELHRLLETRFNSDITHWPTNIVTEAPSQKNNVDCGMYVCKYIETFLSTAEDRWPPEDWEKKMEDFRKIFAYELICFGKKP